MNDKPVGRLDIEELLRDRKWHKASELVRALKDRITPERASMLYVNRSHGPHRERQRKTKLDEPMASRVASGRKFAIERICHALKSSGTLELRGRGTEKEFRLKEWFCWACGKRQTEDCGRPFILKLCEKCDDEIFGGKVNSECNGDPARTWVISQSQEPKRDSN